MRTNKKPLVSIGMPVFNEEQFIGKAIDSLLQQDFKDFELIISDNASIDRTFEICTEYKDKDQRIKLHRNEKNIGGANFLQLLKLSSGKYFMFAGGHDMWTADILNRYLEGFRRLENCILVYSPATYIDKSDNIIKVDAPDNLKKTGKFSTFKNIITGSISSNAFCGLMKTDAMLKTSLTPACIGADTILLSELSLYGDFSQLEESFYFRRKNRAKESTQQKISRYTDEIFNKLHDHWKPILKKQPYEHMVYKYLCMVQNNNLSLGDQSILNETILDTFKNWGVQPSNIFKFILEIHHNKSKLTQPTQADHLIGSKRAKQHKQFLDIAIFSDSLKETKYNVLKNNIGHSIASSDNKMSNKKFPSDRKYDVCYILYDTSKWGGVKGTLVQINGLVERGYRVCLISKSGPPEWFTLKGDFIQSPELKVKDIPISDIIIATWHPTVPIAYMAKKGIAVHYCRGYEGEDPNLSDNQRTQIKKNYRLPTVKIANSPHIVSFLKKIFASDVYLVRNDINHDIFYPQQNVSKRDLHERWRVLIVGPYEIAWKGIQDCIQACNILKQKYGLDIEIIRASQLPITNEELALLKSYVADHYKYYHNLSEQKMAQLYNSCDLLLCGSYPIVESFGRPVMEALACGLPTVVTNIHAFTDYDPTHDYSIFVDPGDIDAMANAAKKIIENANLRENLTRRGIEVSAEYNNDRTLDDLELALSDIYNRYAKNSLEPNLESEKMKQYYDFSRPEVQALVKTTSKVVLDVGCASGNLGAQLKASLGAEVWGIEVVEQAAKTAEKKLDRVICGNIEKVLKLLPDHYFDTIIFADVLEHLIDPFSVLEQIRAKLSQDGEIIASIPNVRHWSVLKDLLEGRWDYVDAGILDRTHLRFFTKYSLIQMFMTAGLRIEKLQGTVIQGYEVPETVITTLSSAGIDTSSLAEEGKIYQYLIVAQPEKVVYDKTCKDKLVSIVILTHNQLEYTKKCIDSIFKHTQEPFELIVVDNGSTDGTVEYLESEAERRKPEGRRQKTKSRKTEGRRQEAEVRIKIIKNKENLGFAAGNNQGMAEASGNYVVLMNNDLVVTPAWLTRMMACAKRNPQIGIVGPVSNYVSGPQLIKDVSYDTTSLARLNKFSRVFAKKHAGQAKPFWRVVGFCMLIKRAVIEKIGGLDGRFGLGNFEDDDFSLRAALAGFESWIAQDCFVHHFGSRTFVGAKIDYRESLHKNWEIFKEKWGLPKELPYGSPYNVMQISKDGFVPEKHYCPLTGGNFQWKNEYGNTSYDSNSNAAEKIYINEIQLLINKGKDEKATIALEELIAVYPKFALAYNDLGVLYFNKGEKEKALSHYKKAVQLQPKNITYQKNLADFYYVELGRTEDALKLYNKVLYVNPEDVEVLLIIGHICISLKKFNDAKVFYNKVLDINPLNEEARQILDKLLNQEVINAKKIGTIA